ncbi:MAG: NAD-dependent deacylase [Prevotella sp.]|nr:NAD-dependent deacylase [Bacteroidales bacterium]MDY4956425.1 NAD-dependent deacylase [Prevotella sp.]MDY5320676.1 NAD-dependent deacylase [Prevotella sp.]
MKKKVVFLTGAGMSVESGFKTFRGNDGLWENYPVEQVASHEGWIRDPVLVNNFYNGLRRKLWQAQPNEGHRLIAGMEAKYDVTVITQNVDDLHERAGSSRVIHLHGELSKACSSDNPDDKRYQVELSPEHNDVAPGEKAGDGSLLRPFIVFFGEAVPMMESAARVAMEADVFVIIGTSLNVYPAAGLVAYAPQGCPVYLIDPNPVGVDSNVTAIRKGASEGMRELLRMI